MRRADPGAARRRRGTRPALVPPRTRVGGPLGGPRPRAPRRGDPVAAGRMAPPPRGRRSPRVTGVPREGAGPVPARDGGRRRLLRTGQGGRTAERPAPDRPPKEVARHGPGVL